MILKRMSLWAYKLVRGPKWIFELTMRAARKLNTLYGEHLTFLSNWCCGQLIWAVFWCDRPNFLYLPSEQQRAIRNVSPVVVVATHDTDQLQKDIDLLGKWERNWQMSFNTSKCHAMTITHKKNPIKSDYFMGNYKLEEVKHHPYLGVEY